MSDHKHGKMDITAQEQAFAGFMTWSVRVGAFSIFVLVCLALFNT